MMAEKAHTDVSNNEAMLCTMRRCDGRWRDAMDDAAMRCTMGRCYAARQCTMRRCDGRWGDTMDDGAMLWGDAIHDEAMRWTMMRCDGRWGDAMSRCDGRWGDAMHYEAMRWTMRRCDGRWGDAKDDVARLWTSVLHGPGIGPRAGSARSPWAGPGQVSIIVCGPGRVQAWNLQGRVGPGLVSNNFAGCGPGLGLTFPGLGRAYSESHYYFNIMVKDYLHLSIAIRSLFSML